MSHPVALSKKKLEEDLEMRRVPPLQCHPGDIPQHIPMAQPRLSDAWEGAWHMGHSNTGSKRPPQHMPDACKAKFQDHLQSYSSNLSGGKIWHVQKLGNHQYQGDFLHSKMQRNPLPQWFSQGLLKYFPKCSLISPLA